MLVENQLVIIKLMSTAKVVFVFTMYNFMLKLINRICGGYSWKKEFLSAIQVKITLLQRLFAMHWRRCWIAPRDIPYGSAWAGEISKAISNSSAFLFLSSEKSNASEQVSREIQLAIENGLTIIPIMLDDSEYSDANKYYLATIHCMIEYDAAKTHKLVEDILKTLPSEGGAEEEGESKEKKDKKPRKKSTF